MQCFILFFAFMNRFLLINDLYVDDAHVVCQHLERSSHYVCRWNDVFRKNLIDYHAFFNFFCSCHHLHVLARQTTRRQHIVFSFFSSLQTFHQFFWRQHSQILSFLLFFDLEYHSFFSSNLLSLTLLIDVIICRNDDNCEFDALHVFCFRHECINKQNERDFRSISFKIIQFDVHLSQC